MVETSAASSSPAERGDPSPPATGRFGARLRPVAGRWSQIVNICLLVAGLALGQGTIFIVQTVLLAAGEYELLAAFATHYSFAILGIIVVDAGANITLARAVVRLSAEDRPHAEAWQMFCDTSVIRLLTALVIGAAATLYVLVFSSDGFSRWYVMSALPGLLLWSVNGVGLLDGQKLSGISGMTGAIAYVTSAVGLMLAMRGSHEAAGAILGGAFSIGYLVTLIAQWAVLAGRGWHPQLHKPTWAGLTQALKDGCALSFQIVPGQINMRVQLVLSAAYLGAETTALFVYAKQIVTAATQVLQFVLRVEFPGLVEKLSGAGRQGLAGIIGAQKLTLFCAVMFSVGATAVAGIVAVVSEGGLHRAAVVIAGFAPTILTVALLQMTWQGLAALGAYAASAWALAIGAAAGIAASYLLVSQLHVFAFAAAEVVLNLTTLYVGFRYLRR
ncbi:hypothetical protein [Bradyrhizobium cajani]|uniref:Uncharacterized protein n=1 Tax=Bradyrhizobium cajani TaxID=1928661 RepID=A0A844T2N9_9BRAD|nr:hypothetical protein [Bradyrhizobium cajani]MCP3368314.1 hypothetical protein [Bradyrhizobium cajani]MVT73137.1 hypothetical protein [Bradyrhizobium cajani]